MRMTNYLLSALGVQSLGNVYNAAVMLGFLCIDIPTMTLCLDG